MTRLVPLLACFFALVLAPTASAGWFPADLVDGPADVDRVAVDMGREDTGMLGYVKRDAAGARAWLSGLSGGAWSAPVPVSGAGATDVAVASGDRGRAAAVWIENGDVFGILAGQAAVRLSSGGGATGVAMDLGVNGVAYAVWSQGGNVLAARLQRQTWQAVPEPLDIDPAAAAGQGAGRPRVTVAADGSAVVVWGEAGADTRTHVFMRRLYGIARSSLPQDATLTDLGGVPAGSADSPEVDVQFDRSFAWVAFRQDVGGVTHTFARRLRASTFEAPVALDGGAPSAQPGVAMSGLGEGHSVAAASGTIVGGALHDDVFAPPARLDAGGVASDPVVTFSERDDTAVAWRAGDTVRGRIAESDGPFAVEALLSRPELGPVPAGAIAASSNRVGDVAVAMLQGAPGARHVTVAMHDRVPSRPVLRRMRRVVRPRPLVRWNPGQDFLGPQNFRVVIDGHEAGTTARTSWRPPRGLRRGRHRVQVIGVDRRGQASTLSRSQRFTVKKPKRSRRDRG